MDDVSIAEAKEHLEELVARARRGETVTISDGAGSVRLTATPNVRSASRVTDTMEPFVPLAQDRVPGQLKGKMRVPARLLEPMTDDELRDWYGDGA